MDHLHRSIAPIAPPVWEVLDEEARRVLRHRLVARRLVDFRGPLGWTASGVPTGRVAPLHDASLPPGVVGTLRQTLPLVELRTELTLARVELEAILRGAPDPDLEPLVEAATRLASAEDQAIFYGVPSAGIRGIVRDSAHAPLDISNDYTAYPRLVAEAIDRLDRAGVEGPYALALGSRCWVGLQASTTGGYPVLDHVRRLVEDRVVRAPMVDGAVVLSARGDDFALTVGVDLSLGYASHDDAHVRLFLLETIAFHLIAPEAAVPLRYP